MTTKPTTSWQYEFNGIPSIIPAVFFCMLLQPSVQTLISGQCNFTAYYDYPNTYYCINQQSTWSQGTSLFSQCYSSGTMIQCQCQCQEDGLSSVLRKCVNIFDQSVSLCYTGEQPCGPCSQGTERRQCGCNRFSPYDCGPGICQLCMPGKFSKNGVGECQPCQVCTSGNYAQIPCLSGQDGACVACPGGSFCTGGSSAASTSAIQATAQQCQVGTYCPEGSSAPSVCRESMAMICDTAGLQYFVLGCRPGYKFTSNVPAGPLTNTGATCTICPAGTALVLGSAMAPHTISSCTPCSAGSYSDTAGAQKCQACPAGTYSTGVGMSGYPCLQCVPGTYALQSGLSTCSACVAGTYLSSAGAYMQGLCFSCPAGTYSSAPGSSQCTLCAGGSYTAIEGGIACTACSQGKTTYTSLYDGTLVAPGGASSSDQCLICPKGTYTCNCLNDTSAIAATAACAKSSCFSLVYQPCIACTSSSAAAASSAYCPGNGFRIARVMPVLSQTFLYAAAPNAWTDNVVLPCSSCGQDMYIASSCTLWSDTVCKPCSKPQMLFQYIQAACTATADAVLVACNTSRISGQTVPGGICNPCPPGSTSGGYGLCVACPTGTFKSLPGNDLCVSCDSNSNSASGAGLCTTTCQGGFAPDGINCIFTGNGVTAVVPQRTAASWNAAAASFQGGLLLPDGNFIAIQNFALGRGMLWHFNAGHDGDVWAAGGDATQGGVADGSGAMARYGSIGALVQQQQQQQQQPLVANFILTEPDLGTIRLLKFDGSVFFSSIGTITASQPSGAAAQEDGTFLVADAGANCVWLLTSIKQLWRGSTDGTIAGGFTLPSNTAAVLSAATAAQETLLAHPISVAVLDSASSASLFAGITGQLALVMDARGIWAFDSGTTLQAGLLYICGNPNAAAAAALPSPTYCTALHFAKTGITSMAAGITGAGPAVVMTYPGGVLIFLLKNQPSSHVVRLLAPTTTTTAAAATITSTTTNNLFWQGQRLFVVVDRQIIEMATAALRAGFFSTDPTIPANSKVACLCNAGLYCNDQTGNQCVQAPAGTYVPAAWSVQPIPCPRGTISSGNRTTCIPCPNHPVPFTTHGAGALNCELLCLQNEIYSTAAKACVPGCNASRGEYHSSTAGCVLCPLGSQATSMMGQGDSIATSCPACPPGTYGVSPGLCAPCPTAVFPGTTSCIIISMAQSQTSSCSEDGGSPLLCASSSPGPSQANDNAASATALLLAATFFNHTAFVSSALCNSSVTDLSVTSAGNVYVAMGGTCLWLAPHDSLVFEPYYYYYYYYNYYNYNSNLLPSQQPQPQRMDLVEAMDDDSLIFTATLGDSCIWSLNGSSSSSSSSVIIIFAGVCGAPGDADGSSLVARLGQVQDMVLMQVEDRTPILFVSTFLNGCATIRAVSLYDRSVSTFVGSDQLHMPVVPLTSCPNVPFLHLTIARGTSDLYYSSSSQKVWYVDVYGTPSGSLSTAGTGQYSSYKPDATFYSASSASMGSMCARGLRNVNDLRVVAVGQTLLVSSTQVPGWRSTQQLPWPSSSLAAITKVGCAGKRVWAAVQNSVYLIGLPSSSLASACLGGFVSVSMPATMCVEVGVGRYTLPTGEALDCKAGTYGITARGASHTAACKPCPPGQIAPMEGSLGCDLCPAGYLSSGAGTQCVQNCPAGTIPNNYDATTGRNTTCTTCSSGFEASVLVLGSSQCVPCLEGFYSNSSTGGICVECPTGWTSPAAAFHCVPVCPDGACSVDGTSCVALVEDWEVVTSVTITGGTAMRAVAVGPGGDIFYTDGSTLQYFFDDCPAMYSLSDEGACMQSGVDLLPQQCTGNSAGTCRRGFSALAAASGFADAPSHSTVRFVYAACCATHAVYRFPIVYSPLTGSVDIEATVQLLATTPASFQMTSAALSPAGFAAANFYSPSAAASGGGDVAIAGWLLFGGFGAGAVDGPFASAKLNTPSEIELSHDDTRLVISDFLNSRIRVADLQAANVTTLIGSSSNQWRFGPINTNSAVPPASVFQPLGLGLSQHDNQLYLVMNTDNMVGVVSSPLSPSSASSAVFTRFCAMLFASAANPQAVAESCIASSNSKTCMLNRPYDVLVSSAGGAIYVAVNQGLTRIDPSTLSCQQIAGYWWNFSPSNRGLQDGKINLVTGQPTSLFNQPFKLAEDKMRGILYIADLLNGALRRIFISSNCRCPEGNTMLQAARACYSPTQSWDTAMTLIHCPAGQFALEGDTACRTCADAAVYGLAATACIQWQAQQSKAALLSAAGFSYAQLLGQPRPAGAIASDWYGQGPPPPSPSWDDLFRSDSPVLYKLGSAPGRAPFGGEFMTLTLDTSLEMWIREESPSLQPSLLLPGLWYPCNAPKPSILALATCQCAVDTAAFLEDSSQQGSGGGRIRWQELRTAAFEGGAQVLASSSQTTTTTNTIGMWSRFMIFGTDAPTAMMCGGASSSGPCFPAFVHVNQDPIVDSGEGGGGTVTLTLDAASAGIVAAAKNLVCASGWPAHYACQDGYMWVAPNTSALSDIQGFPLDPSLLFTTQVACISCIPGTFSVKEEGGAAGGPYQCEPCVLGTYSSAVGSTACEFCPVGTYADSPGMSACQTCAPNHWTYLGAQTAAACSPCAPGTPLLQRLNTHTTPKAGILGRGHHWSF